MTYYDEGAGSIITVCQSGCDYTTIQTALGEALAGDTVKVMDAAVYTSEAGDLITMKTGVDLVSDTGVTPTIYGSYAPAVTFEGQLSNSTLDGFTITGKIGEGGQIYLNGSTSHGAIARPRLMIRL